MALLDIITKHLGVTSTLIVFLETCTTRDINSFSLDWMDDGRRSEAIK